MSGDHGDEAEPPAWRAYLIEREQAEGSSVRIEPDLAVWLRLQEDVDLEKIVNRLLRRHMERSGQR